MDNYFPEHLDGYFSNSSLKILFWLWETLAEERGLFPPKRCYNDTSHLGGFLYQNMFYSSIHQALNWFCLIVTLYDTGLEVQPQQVFNAFPCALEIPRKKVSKEKNCPKYSNKAEVVRLKQNQGEKKGQKDWWEAFFVLIIYSYCVSSLYETRSCCWTLIRTGSRPPKVWDHLQMRVLKISFLIPVSILGTHTSDMVFTDAGEHFYNLGKRKHPWKIRT